MAGNQLACFLQREPRRDEQIRCLSASRQRSELRLDIAADVDGSVAHDLACLPPALQHPLMRKAQRGRVRIAAHLEDASIPQRLGQAP